MVDLDTHDIDELTAHEKAKFTCSSSCFFSFLTRDLLLLNCFAVYLTFKKNVQYRAVVPVNVVVQELGILHVLQWEAAGFNELLRARRQWLSEEELG